MLETANYKFKKRDLLDSPPDITLTNPNWDIIDLELKKLSDGLTNLPTDLGQQITNLQNKIGNLASLTTTEKTSLVLAINELRQSVTTHLAERASLTKVGHTQLSSALDSEDESKAATPMAIKKTNDKVDEQALSNQEILLALEYQRVKYTTSR